VAEGSLILEESLITAEGSFWEGCPPLSGNRGVNHKIVLEFKMPVCAHCAVMVMLLNIKTNQTEVRVSVNPCISLC